MAPGIPTLQTFFCVEDDVIQGLTELVASSLPFGSLCWGDQSLGSAVDLEGRMVDLLPAQVEEDLLVPLLVEEGLVRGCLLYTSPSPRDA